MKPLLKHLKNFILNYDNSDLKEYTLLTLGQLSSNDEIAVELLEMGTMENLVQFLDKVEKTTKLYCLRTIGHIFSLPDKLTGEIDFGVVDGVIPHLYHDSKRIRKEAAWTLANIAAAGYVQVDKIMQYEEMDVLDRLFYMINNEDFDVGIFFFTI